MLLVKPHHFVMWTKLFYFKLNYLHWVAFYQKNLCRVRPQRGHSWNKVPRMMQLPLTPSITWKWLWEYQMGFNFKTMLRIEATKNLKIATLHISVNMPLGTMGTSTEKCWDNMSSYLMCWSNLCYELLVVKLVRVMGWDFIWNYGKHKKKTWGLCKSEQTTIITFEGYTCCKKPNKQSKSIHEQKLKCENFFSSWNFLLLAFSCNQVW
jgi:hypothetical protein